MTKKTPVDPTEPKFVNPPMPATSVKSPATPDATFASPLQPSPIPEPAPQPKFTEDEIPRFEKETWLYKDGTVSVFRAGEPYPAGAKEWDFVDNRKS